MYLLREAIVSHDISNDQQAQIKKLYGIKRMPQYFLSLLWAMQQIHLSDLEKQDMGILYVSHVGPIQQVQKYIDDLLIYPPEECSPVFFSNSVFNAPVAFLTKYMDIQGPSLSLCGFQQIIKASVLSAYSWLKTSYCSKVLVIYSDENADISQRISKLTGLQLFQHTHIILLGQNNEDAGGDRLIPEQIIKHVKLTHNLEE